MDGIELRELPGVVRRGEVGELVPGLLAEIGAVHQKQDAPGAAVLEQAIDDVDGGEGLARPGGHLDERPLIGLGKGLFEAADGAGLDRPQAGLVQGRQFSQLRAQGRGLRHPRLERLGPREVEDRAAPRHRVEPVGEVGYGAVGLEQERQGDAIHVEPVGDARGILRRLGFHPGQGSLRLGFDGAGDRAVYVEQVVGGAEPGLHGELAHGDAGARGEVELLLVLDQPARRLEVGVDIAARPLLGSIAHVTVGPGLCKGSDAGEDLLRTPDL